MTEAGPGMWNTLLPAECQMVLLEMPGAATLGSLSASSVSYCSQNHSSPLLTKPMPSTRSVFSICGWGVQSQPHCGAGSSGADNSRSSWRRKEHFTHPRPPMGRSKVHGSGWGRWTPSPLHLAQWPWPMTLLENQERGTGLTCPLSS